MFQVLFFMFLEIYVHIVCVCFRIGWINFIDIAILNAYMCISLSIYLPYQPTIYLCSICCTFYIYLLTHVAKYMIIECPKIIRIVSTFTNK